jgi:feruloyl esterase
MLKRSGAVSPAALSGDSNGACARGLRIFLTVGAVLGFTAVASHPVKADACSNLINLRLTNATVVSAATVSGSVRGPDGKTYGAMPSFCNVAILATPTNDSAINILLWMPTAAWNGRFQGAGNGGYGGSVAIDAQAMIYAIKHGFAVVSSDMGTAPSANNDADALIGHPQKWIDWGYRATYLMTVLGKQVVHNFYHTAPRYSYWNGCSTGGQQALMLAQKYPTLYDGILAGAPAHDRTHVHTALLWLFAKSHAKPQNYITPDKVTLLANEVLKACVTKSGGAPGDTFLTDPRKCDWRPKSIQCTSAGQANCLSPEQVNTADRLYQGPTDPVTNRVIFPGNPKGSEAASSFGWNANQAGLGAEANFGSMFKWMFGPTFTFPDFDFHQDMADMDAVLGPILNFTSPNLDAFRGRGGKLLMYHGWADPLISPQSSIDYYTAVVKRENSGVFNSSALAKTQKYLRLFMVPGMNHCFGGPGPHAFGNEFSGNIVINEPPVDDANYHALKALMQWVENGRAPERIIATKYVNDTPSQGIAMQRPICPFPKVPRYIGDDPTQALNFICQ